MKRLWRWMAETSTGSKVSLGIVWLFLAMGILLMNLGIISPTEVGIPCLFRMLSGFHCLGCGATRCLENFFHGNIIRAFYFHPLLAVCCILFLAGLFYQSWRIFMQNEILRRKRKKPKGILWGLSFSFLILSFMVIRNLPFYQAAFY